MHEQAVHLQESTPYAEHTVILTEREIRAGWVIEWVGDRRMKVLDASYLRSLAAPRPWKTSSCAKPSQSTAET